jgi:hypothetical protein
VNAPGAVAPFGVSLVKQITRRSSTTRMATVAAASSLEKANREAEPAPDRGGEGRQQAPRESPSPGHQGVVFDRGAHVSQARQGVAMAPEKAVGF